MQSDNSPVRLTAGDSRRYQLEKLQLTRICCASPKVRVADPRPNADEIIKLSGVALEAGAHFLVTPELSISGYTCGDLFGRSRLLSLVLESLGAICEETAGTDLTVMVGAPLEFGSRLYNCAVVICGGGVVGVVPKSYIPNSGEFYERRWFESGRGIIGARIDICGQSVPFGAGIVFGWRGDPAIKFGVEVCEDLWVVAPPSNDLALSGATLLFNLSASNEVMGKASYRRQLVAGQSARCIAGYVYCSAGPTESSTDTVFSGHSIIAENGKILKESGRFEFETNLTIADIDLGLLAYDRLRNSSFAIAAPTRPAVIVEIGVERRSRVVHQVERRIDRNPFVPVDVSDRAEVCNEVFDIQSTALSTRLKNVGVSNVVVGISGGLDSTLALLVIVKAFDRLGLPRDKIKCVTMPGLGTSERTLSNAMQLVRVLGATLLRIPIDRAVLSHLADINHDPTLQDLTYENAQARERTQVLMDLANKYSALVVGTGDLSEAALGWCTFNGDHMSMYHVNSGVPKTLVRYVVSWCGESWASTDLRRILQDICETPISPELLPLGPDGETSQHTELLLGPYELHDFFLYHFLRAGSESDKILCFAVIAFGDRYTESAIRTALATFLKRFFTQQFKRSSMPDGPKIGSVALSPRSDWRMPSDIDGAAWCLTA